MVSHDEVDPPASVSKSSARDPFANLPAHEREAIRERRRLANAATASTDPAATTVGLALSGGGIRSATFSLGVLRGLASNRLLPRVDYLSTVSGGGYAGGMLGRLIGSIGLERAQAALERSDSLVLWWLRRNGRYLTPAGSRDLGMAVVTYLRAWLAVQVEFAFFGLLAGVLIILPHLLQNELGWFNPEFWKSWPSAWWLMAALLWILAVPGTMIAYWVARDAADPHDNKPAGRAGPTWRDALMLLAMVAALAWLVDAGAWRWGNPQFPVAGLPLGLISLGTLAAAILRYASVLWRLRPSLANARASVATERNRLTLSLRRWSVAALILFGLGLLDFASWALLDLLSRGGGANWLIGGIGIGSVALAILRALAEPIQKLESKATASRFDWRSRALNLFGHVLALFLILLWATLVQWLVFDNSSVPGWVASEPVRALVLVGVAVAWLGFTATHAETANASSLHSFYRARVTRAYLSVGNAKRFSAKRADGSTTPLDPDASSSESALDAVSSVTEVLGGDDMPISDYRPEQRGGPIHLINSCLNQTHDDNSGLYNADRKGCMLTMSARGFEWGAHAFHPISAADDYGSLGRWVAISGAAAAPGAGAYTSPGWAMTLFFLGVRLGYWLRNPLPTDPQRKATFEQRLRILRSRLLAKPQLLANEARARFGGISQPWWYLSDGGHFENTAVYPLLRRRLDFIILADCGADAAFELGDLDNLVRKARIDFGADIEFYIGEEAEKEFGVDNSTLSILSPEDLITNTSARGILLGRIRYADQGPERPAKTGTLVVVKPNLHKALDADLLGYALRNPDFPQQGTGDQFFDEAQWESYQRLGFDFGRALTSTWLGQLPGWSKPATHDASAPRLRKSRRSPAAKEDADLPFWRRTMPAAALGTTLGIGASTTLLLAAWQAIDQVRKDDAARDTQVLARIDKSDALLDSLDLKPLRPIDFSEGSRIQRQVADLMELKDPQRNDPLQSRIDRQLQGFKAQCDRALIADNQNPPTDRLCGMVIPLESNNTPFRYWSPTCLSGYARLGDFRGCHGPEQAIAAVSVAPQASVESGQTAAANPQIKTEPQASPTTAATPQIRVTAMRLPGMNECFERGLVLYPQVYDEASRQAATASLKSLDLSVAASKHVAKVENVVRSAELKGLSMPARWRKPTLIVHQPGDLDCAEVLQGVIDRNLLAPDLHTDIRPLPASLKSQRHVIELWLPPDALRGATAK